ncbi:hypothetical protein KC19_1G209400 [Ceratodon purpureus]|uniref:Uncharacterized protein n=1 Tax=Ceratodon purpureus TaxID=3225 RepID=A0A8T0J8Q6_CERPU|nr:hypothetical protein KC19_1G209400 [Ceratodon purpureus]
MSHPRGTHGGGPKGYAHLCENCEPMKCGSTSKLSQGTLKSDAASRERQENLENQLSDDRRVLLAITVEIEDGCVEHIQLKEGDSAEAVAMKFCQDHALPEQFVAPLTEHIVNNIISISKENSDIVFNSHEEHISYEDQNSTLRGGAPFSPVMQGSDVVDSVPKPREYRGRSPVAAEASALLARREHRSNMDPPLMASQKVSRDQHCHLHLSRPCDECHKPILRKKKRRKRGRKKVSDRLLAPTVTSLAKIGRFEYNEKPRSPRPRPLSEAAKAVYMRLYTEYIRHEHRSRDEVRRSNASYEQNIRRRKMGLSKTTWRLTRMRGKAAKQYRNYGELLYAEGLTMRQNHLKAVADKQKHDEAKELAELQPKPKISKRAKNTKRGEDKVWSRLNEFKPKQDQLLELRHEVWESKLMECTFKPRINQNWKYDGRSEQDSVIDYGSRFEQLFRDAESRRRRRAEYMEWYPEGWTFQPTINRGLPNWPSMEGEWQLERCVFRRLLENASRVLEKKQMQERLAHRPLDPLTGRELYKPHTGRKPNNRNPAHFPIGDYLYKMKFAFDSKMRSLNDKDCKMKKELAECQYVGPTSQKLLRRLKERGLKQIFDLLDHDKDGIVDLTTANFDRLNDDVVEGLTRLMNVEGGQCEAKNKKLNFEQFVKLMLLAEKKYYCGLQLHLGLKHKIHGGERTFTFQSEMDRLSRNLAIKRRKYSTHNQWFKIIIDEFAKRQQKVEEWRKERQEQEMAACPFKPELKSTYRAVKRAPDPGSGSISETVSNIIDKVQQEVHGFYFQDERGGPELLGVPAPASPTPSSRAMATGRTSLSPSPTGRRRLCSTTHSKTRQEEISELDDLPKANNPVAKSSMFFSLMGA